MIISEASLEQVLAARDRRAAAQREMLAAHGLPLLSFTLNIPGPVKRTPLTELAFNAGLAALNGLPRREERIIREAAGSEALLAAELPPEELKALAMALEGSPIGRLYDMDVITPAGKLSRGEQRRCIVCGAPGPGCARSRTHGLEAVLEKVDGILRAFAGDTLAALGRAALEAEVLAAPKPGLVDPLSNGAHRDMTVDTFLRSAAALEPYFADAAAIGMETAALTPPEAMERLRARGMRAEEEMLSATGGVNTHKGMVYSLGILLAGAGRGLISGAGCLEAAAAIARSDAAERLALARRRPQTHGDMAYITAGAAGARGEAAAGFPGAVKAAEYLAGHLAGGFSEGEAAALALCRIMADTEDTNLLHRGGKEGLEYARAQARRILALPEGERLRELCALDGDFTARNLSPGGCADILALGIFLLRAGELTEL